tara:strand:- start:234 stop:707 length:474 start_codon:yes stop_codon:yes gene_type:complete
VEAEVDHRLVPGQTVTTHQLVEIFQQPSLLLVVVEEEVPIRHQMQYVQVVQEDLVVAVDLRVLHLDLEEVATILQHLLLRVMLVVPVYQMVAVSVKVEAVVVPVVLVRMVLVVVLVMVVLVFNYLQHLEIQTPHTEHQDQVLRELSGLLVVEQGGHT